MKTEQITVRKMPNSITERLAQGRWWRTKDGVWMLIEEMAPQHRRNTAAMLLRNAAAYEFVVSATEIIMFGDLSEHAGDAVMEALARRMENPHKWMRNTALYRALLDGLPKFDGAVQDAS